MIVTVVGARPQFIKAAVVSKALVKIGLTEKIIHTGQHYDDKMSDVFWRELKLPGYVSNLNVGSGTHGEQTAQMIVKIESYLLQQKGEVKGVLLYGDTNSTIAGAIVAAKLNIPIIHVEAGLRSFNRTMPEEINRIVTDRLSHILFCPSQISVEQLAQEGITERVFDVGDVMYDALLTFKENEPESQPIPFDGPFVLLTIHRASNTDDVNNLKNIFSAIQNSSLKFLWPVHPRSGKVIREHNLDVPDNLIMVDPLSYVQMLKALERCEKVVTDSGGLQKEAYWMKKQCITLRSESEWVETFHNGWNTLVGADGEKLHKALLAKPLPNTWRQLYGDGSASEKIAMTIREIL
jgi:UDP-N-acetylglucosamine 2-epimerase